jgi:hypothetical protein
MSSETLLLSPYLPHTRFLKLALAGHVARIGGGGGIYVICGKARKKDTTRNIKMNLKDLGWSGMD